MSGVDCEAPIRFLNTAFEPNDWLAVFLKSYETGRVAQRVGPVSWVQSDRFQRWLRAMNARKYNVFVSVNAIASGRRSRTRDAIGAVRHVFLDADQDGSGVLSQLAARAELPTPSYVLQSSPNHIHVFWRVVDFDHASVERLQKQLALELQADPAATPVTQNTRLPGFFNSQTHPAAFRDRRIPGRQVSLRTRRLSLRQEHATTLESPRSAARAATRRPRDRAGQALLGFSAASDRRPARRRPYVSRLLPTHARVRAR